MEGAGINEHIDLMEVASILVAYTYPYLEEAHIILRSNAASLMARQIGIQEFLAFR